MKVLVSVCNNPPWIHKRVVFALLRLQSDPRYEVTTLLPTWRPYEHGLNRVVKDVLEVYEDHDYWLNIDADNPPTNNPLDLIELNKDIIGLPTPVWHDAVPGDQPYYFNVMKEVDGGWKPQVPKENDDPLIEVDSVGSGCMLVHRRVLEGMQKPLFMRGYDEDGLVEYGHDYLFAKNAKKAGFEVWTHFDYLCEHYNETDLLSQIKAFQNMKEVNGNN